MTSPTFDDWDHETHMQAAFECAREAADRGDEPFGSVLVREDEVIHADSNRIVTEDDLRRHPELTLAQRAHRAYSAAERAEMVMYTSTEPCPMCAGGMATAGFARVVYSVGAHEIASFTGSEPAIRADTILDGVTEVLGPVLNHEGREVHRSYGW
ncbi:MAG: nucleoside deaminase [Halobellus sp.]|uniref:nucleoside deaminase n=1 Tax=Halobellus sp. TaxID=1979212 RepID=UPI0035D5141F